MFDPKIQIISKSLDLALKFSKLKDEIVNELKDFKIRILQRKINSFKSLDTTIFQFWKIKSGKKKYNFHFAVIMKVN